jgi:hypothetical protein
MSITPSHVYDVPDISCDHCKHAIEAEEAVRDSIAAAGYDVAAKL